MKGSNCGLPVAAGLITVKVRKTRETRHSKGQNMVRRRVACLAVALFPIFEQKHFETPLN